MAGFEKGTKGISPPSGNGSPGVFLTDVIVALGFTDKRRVDEAEEVARSSGKTVEQLLLDAGAIDENQLSLAIAERNQLDHVDLDRFEVDMRAAEMIGRSVALRCGAVPIAYGPDEALIVAVQDPFDTLAMRRIETTTEKPVRPVIAAASAIKRLIERLPDEAAAQSSEAEVPRIRSQRELLLEEADAAESDASADAGIDDPQADAHDEPEVAEPEAEAPEEDGPAAEESEEDAPEAETQDAAISGGLESFDGLTMDLGPMSMNDGEAEAPAAAAKSADDDEDVKREQLLDRELTETKGKVAELERRLEEVVKAAWEASATHEKLSALRRAIQKSDR